MRGRRSRVIHDACHSAQIVCRKRRSCAMANQYIIAFFRLHRQGGTAGVVPFVDLIDVFHAVLRHVA
eukprot:1368970-Pyramimonas_sp.AAC.1